MFRLVRRTIDPSSAELLRFPRDERELIQQLSHHWCAFYDNISSLPTWVSDALCRAVTGGGFSKRELYTDDDDVIYNFLRCIGLNGINIAAQRPDLLDRGLLIGFKHIPNDKRKTEEAFWRDFDKVKGDILGGFLDALSRAIRIYPTIRLHEQQRMADFVKWGCSISEALGIDKKKFLEAYDANVELHTDEAARSSPVAEVILKFMHRRQTWEGSPSDLYGELLEKAKEMGVSTRQKAWPKAPNTLLRRINELVPALMQLGYEFNETRDRTRKVTINTVATVVTDEVHKNNDGETPSIDGYDDTDDILRTSVGDSKFDLNSSVTEANVLGWLRLDWKRGKNEEFEGLIRTQGYTVDQATRLREKWIAEGLLALDPDGWLVWTRG